jgi:hypothetical protein
MLIEFGHTFQGFKSKFASIYSALIVGLMKCKMQKIGELLHL